LRNRATFRHNPLPSLQKDGEDLMVGHAASVAIRTPGIGSPDFTKTGAVTDLAFG
jgi:hypothetical protein